MILRIGGVLLAVLALAFGFCWYGWRYGLTPLPEPAPGVTVQAPPKLALTDLTPTNYWYWVRVLALILPGTDTNLRIPADLLTGPSGPMASLRLRVVDTNLPQFRVSLLTWARCGAIAFTNRDHFGRWLAERPAIDECYRGALQNPEGIGAELANGLELQLNRQSFLLATYPLWLAQESERQGRAAEAFDHLLAAWQLSARAAARRRIEQGSFAALARCWRRLALTGPPLAAGEAQRLLDALAGTTNLLPALDTAYAQRAVPEAAYWPRRSLEEAEWDELSDAFKEGLSEIGQEAKERVERLAARLMGDEVPDNWQPEGLGHLGPPIKALLMAAQRAAARDGDLRQFQAAYFSQVLAKLRQGKLREADEFDAALRASHPGSGLKNFFDRPAVWRLLDWFQSPSVALDNLTRWRCSLETCRLTLALRLYRDRHGAWPERLDELVPELLPALPMEPCSGQPFRYQKKGDTWRIAAGANHRVYEVPGRMDVRMMRRYGLSPRTVGTEPDAAGWPLLCSSGEVKEALAAWEDRQRAQPRTVDVRMLMRYGLVPKGFRHLTPSNSIVAVPATPPATNTLAATNSATRAATNQSRPLPQAR